MSGVDVVTEPVVLDAVAATACPVKTRHAYALGDGGRSPARPRPAAVNGDFGRPVSMARERERVEFVDAVLDRWLALLPGGADLRPAGPDERQRRTAALIAAGCPLIVAPGLPVDRSTHREGAPEALLSTGSTGYVPVLVRWHKVLRQLRDGEEHDPAAEGLRRSGLSRPLASDPAAPGTALRVDLRRADLLQLAHHHRLLESAGAAGPARGALIGTDDGADPDVLTWVELDRPLVRRIDPAADQGWRWSSLLTEADAELAHRVAIADAVARPGIAPDDVVRPVVIDECRTCPWWSTCESELDPDDVSFRLARGRLDRVEVTALRSCGAGTVASLAASPVEELLPRYLPLTAHRADAERRVRTIARRARMLVSGEPIERETTGPIDVPAGAPEIDLDLETSADGRIYLWGFAVDEGGGPSYVEFSRFADLDADAELALARVALGWLRVQVERAGKQRAGYQGAGDQAADGAGVRVYHYSGFEVAMITALAERAPDDELLAWAAAYAQREFVDLLQIVQAHFFGAVGLGLKQIAVQAGFHWRDADPGGLNSQSWFDEAVHATGEPVRAAARRRVLEYNEDDVRATARLRSWLRAR